MTLELNYNNRIFIYEKLKDNLKSIQKCNKLLAKGGHGLIYIIEKNTQEGEKYKAAVKELIFKFPQKFDYKSKIWRELMALSLCNKLVINKITQNLALLYDYSECNNPHRLLLFTELASGDFLQWCYSFHSVDEWKSMLFQLWSAVYVIKKYLKIAHNDLRLPNLLYHQITKKEEFWKYTIDNEDYYIPNTGYIFVVWDFGSVEIMDKEIDPNLRKIIEKKIYLNTDLHFFHDLYNRLEVLSLYNKYNTDDLVKFLHSINNKDAEKFLKELNEDSERRFRKTGRYDEKYKIGLIYYLIEAGYFDELYKNKQDLDPKTSIKLPPEEILDILKELTLKYNYDYKDIVIKFNPNMEKKIPDPQNLIKKYMSKYKDKKPYTLEFIM